MADVAPRIPSRLLGYGVVAPEYNWDDYKGLDVKGKTLVMLVNDPPVPDAANPAELDPKTFGGKAMTYYGRWTYKFEEGARKGAAAVLIVHETAPAGYPFSVVQGNLRAFDLVRPTEHEPRGDRIMGVNGPGPEAAGTRRPELRHAKEQAATRG